MKYIYILAVAAMMALCTSCGSGSGQAENKEDEHGHSHGESSEAELTETQLKTVGIELGHIERKELSNAIHANGQLGINPQDVADVSSLTSGIAARVAVVEGQQVKAGQTVAYIENAEIIDLQQSYISSLDATKLAQQEYERQKALDSHGAGIKKNLQQAQADYNMALAQSDGLRIRLQQIGLDPAKVGLSNIFKQAPVKAPISGTVSKIMVNTGGYVDMQTPLMSIVDNNAVYCRLNIFENDIDRVKPGQSVDIRLTNRRDTRLSGTVADINHTIDTDSKAIAVRVKLDKPEGADLVPGMPVTALINIGKELTEALPDDAVVSSGGKSYIFVVEDVHDEDGHKAYHFEKVEVTAGVSDLGYTQITTSTPLPADALVAVSNAFYIASMTADHGEHSH